MQYIVYWYIGTNFMDMDVACILTKHFLNKESSNWFKIAGKKGRAAYFPQTVKSIKKNINTFWYK